MNVPFDDLGPQSRIWIYQSNRQFSEEERSLIQDNTNRFLEAWTAHGDDLQAGVKILYDQFIVIGVNEAVNQASGCSIDKSVSFIRELENSLNIRLLERSKVAFKVNTEIRLVDFPDIKQMIESGNIRRDDKVFNNSIGSKGQLESEWLVPAAESWIKRYFI